MNLRTFFFLTILLFSFLNLDHVTAQTGLGSWSPETTVILSNETDAWFCKDFSVFLRGLSVTWIMNEMPQDADKNLIIIGGPDKGEPLCSESESVHLCGIRQDIDQISSRKRHKSNH